MEGKTSETRIREGRGGDAGLRMDDLDERYVLNQGVSAETMIIDSIWEYDSFRVHTFTDRRHGISTD